FIDRGDAAGVGVVGLRRDDGSREAARGVAFPDLSVSQCARGYTRTRADTERAARIGASTRRPRETEEDEVQDTTVMTPAAPAHESFEQRISDAITSFCGKMLFVYVHIVAFTIWIATKGFG